MYTNGIGFRSRDWNVLMVIGTTMATAAVLLVIWVRIMVSAEKTTTAVNPPASA